MSNKQVYVILDQDGDIYCVYEGEDLSDGQFYALADRAHSIGYTLLATATEKTCELESTIEKLEKIVAKRRGRVR